MKQYEQQKREKVKTKHISVNDIPFIFTELNQTGKSDYYDAIVIYRSSINHRIHEKGIKNVSQF